MYYNVVYIEINILCLAILAFLTMKLSMNMDKRKSNLDFRNTMIAVMAILLLDVIWGFVDGAHGTAFVVANYIVNVLAFIQAAVIGVFWIQYVMSKLHFKIKLQLRGKIIFFIPLGLLVVLTLGSIWTGWGFYIDAGNVYHRGPVHFLIPAMAFIYLAMAFIMVIFKLANARTKTDKYEAATMTTFFFFPLIGGIFSAMYEGFPCMWPCATISLVIIFVNYRESEISTDALTGLNNRRQFDRRIGDMVRGSSGEDELFLFLMDINDFKSINDNYGHYEGDRALVETAKILKHALAKTNLFLARYGGDEFAIIGQFEGIIEAEALKSKIQRYFADGNLKSGRDYDITMGIGYCKYEEGSTDTIEELIAGADRRLYEDKTRLKSVISSAPSRNTRFFR